MSSTSLSRRAYRRAVAKTRGEYFVTSGSKLAVSPFRTAAISSASGRSIRGVWKRRPASQKREGHAAVDFRSWSERPVPTRVAGRGDVQNDFSPKAFGNSQTSFAHEPTILPLLRGRTGRGEEAAFLRPSNGSSRARALLRLNAFQRP